MSIGEVDIRKKYVMALMAIAFVGINVKMSKRWGE